MWMGSEQVKCQHFCSMRNRREWSGIGLHGASRIPRSQGLMNEAYHATSSRVLGISSVFTYALRDVFTTSPNRTRLTRDAG